jgi:histidinol phosphatase-like enzyme
MSDIKTLRELNDRLETRLKEIGGCMDRFCYLPGQVTNGGCSCLKSTVKMQQALSAHMNFAAAVSSLRKGPSHD